MNTFWTHVTVLGNGGWIWLFLSGLLMIPKKTRDIGVTALEALATCAILTNLILKKLIDRTRPYDALEQLQILIRKETDSSFPSGHTSASFAAATVYAKMGGFLLGIPGYLLASLIAISRLYVGVHYPSDVIAGMGVGIFSAGATMRGKARVLAGERKKEE
jgi:undecaprenyl-diphosphatase